MAISRLGQVLLALVLIAPGARGQVELIGIGSIPGTASDLSGLKGKQSDGTPHNRLGGLGSAIDYTGAGSRYVLASDRGPLDGATDFACRMHQMDILVQPGKTPAVSLKLVSTTLLTDDKGKQLVGTAKTLGSRFDAEGIRVGPKGTFFISDEYGPEIAEFDARGRLLKRFSIPDRFRPGKDSGKVEEEMPPHNTKGRQPNRGMEGLAINPSGTHLYGMMQSPLIQDGGLDAMNMRVGHHCRILEIEIATGKTREFVYSLDSPGAGISEILAINDQEFLVLERDSKGSMDAGLKKIYRIDLRNATDVSRVDALPTKKLGKEIVPASKSLLIDILDPKFGIAGKDCPEKFEGLAIGPRLADGRALLLMTADNDFVAEVPFRVYAFAISEKSMPGLVKRFPGSTRPGN